MNSSPEIDEERGFGRRLRHQLDAAVRPYDPAAIARLAAGHKPRSLRGIALAAGAIAFTLVVVLAVRTAITSPASPDVTDPSEFVALMRNSVNYDFHVYDSPKALADAASFVGIGRIVAVEAGRTIESIGSHATLVIEIEQIIRGSDADLADGKIHVELVTSPDATVEQYRQSAPRGRVVTFLDDRTDIPSIGPTGTPTGARVFAPMPPGLVFEAGDHFVGGYEDLGTMPEKWTLPASFDAFVEAISP